MSISAKSILFLLCCSCLAACQESVTAVAPAPVPTTTVLPTKQTQQVIVDKIDAAQQVNQQRLDAAEKF
ncbi:MAG: hypothetical protein WBP46_06525 [Thiolinea sp.]